MYRYLDTHLLLANHQNLGIKNQKFNLQQPATTCNNQQQPATMLCLEYPDSMVVCSVGIDSYLVW
jgi:hypothetical protein